MNDRRQQPRLNYIDKLKDELYTNDYDIIDIKRVCHLLRLEAWAERLLDRTHEW
jgi:hypothetical protein